MNESFDIFITEKRIDLKALREVRDELCEELEKAYNQISPRLFDQQKKFLFSLLKLDFSIDTPLLKKFKPARAILALFEEAHYETSEPRSIVAR